MATPTRLDNGVGTVKITHPLGMYPLPNPFQVFYQFDDFAAFRTVDWTTTAGGAGSAAALTAGIGGLFLITTATSGAESIQHTTGDISFTNSTSAVNGLKVWFQTRLLMDATVANPDYQVGLASANTTFNGATDGVYFTKATGATTWSFVVKAGSTATTVAIPGTTPVSSAWIDLAYYFDGKGMFYIYFNKVCVATYGTGPTSVGSLGSSLANLPGPTVMLAPVFLNGFHTGTSLLTLDYQLAACEVNR